MVRCGGSDDDDGGEGVIWGLVVVVMQVIRNLEMEAGIG